MHLVLIRHGHAQAAPSPAAPLPGEISEDISPNTAPDPSWDIFRQIPVDRDKDGREISRGTDFDRPLSERGHREAGTLGAWLAAHRIHPDLALCSPARRTRETLAHLLAGLGGIPVIEAPLPLYNSSAMALLARLAALGERTATVLLVAHNPGIEELARVLTGNRPAADGTGIPAGFPPAGAVLLDVPGPWSALAAGGARLEAVFTPPRQPG